VVGVQNTGNKAVADTGESLIAAPSGCDQTVIIGVGLMGGSIGLALARAGLCSKVIGVDAEPTLQDALNVGAITRASKELTDCLPHADLVIIAVPVHLVCSIITKIAPLIKPSATVTDIASVKFNIAETGAAMLGNRFLAGHPMAGSERTGVLNARNDLFSDAAWALTPHRDLPADKARIDLLTSVVQSIGARALILDPARHDRLAALVSHLPHLISFAYNHTIESDEEAELAHTLGAGSYRDLTRVAASDPCLWRDVFIENREWLLAALQTHKRAIEDLEKAVISHDVVEVMEAIQKATGRRQA